MRRAIRLAGVACTLGLATCTENATTPGICPQYCPSTSITIVDTVMQAITRDSAYGRPVGYTNPYTSPYLLADSLPGVRDSRVVMRFAAVAPRGLIGTDTTTGPVIGVDSLWLRLTITQRDTATRNLRLSLYQLPLALDSTKTYADLAGPFSGTPIRTVNVDTLLARPGRRDAATGDSVVVDTITHFIVLFVKLDSIQAPYSVADTGKVAFGIRVRADTQATVRLAAFEYTGLGPVIYRYLRVDSLGAAVVHPAAVRASPAFDSFVFDPPAAGLDSTLVVGGIPSARSILRIALPRTIRDSAQIIRATLELFPVVAPRGIAADSFGLVVHAVLADFGAKSTLDGAHVDTTRVHVGMTDTVHVEITNILRYWAADTTKPTTVVLRQTPEGADFAEIRFFASSHVAQRPLLRVTYIPHLSFGAP